MKYKAILFDLDGTLLPMDTDRFIKGYFEELAKTICPLGIKPDTLFSGIWTGIKAMVANDGVLPNCEVFWNTFRNMTDADIDIFRPATDNFYSEEFKKSKEFTGDNPNAREAVRLARLLADKVILATNPLFPMNGQRTRLGFIDLTPEDFDLVTCYESDYYCKPNEKYYLSICSRHGLNPSECLMIGNDEGEDMHPCVSLGMDTFLVTDCLIPDSSHLYTGRKGTFTELLAFLKDLHTT